MTETVTLRLEDLGCVGLLRVLRIITKDGPLNISLLSRRANMNHKSVDLHVRKLVEKGLVVEKRYSAIRMIKPSFTSFTIRFKRGIGVTLVLES